MLLKASTTILLIFIGWCGHAQKQLNYDGYYFTFSDNTVANVFKYYLRFYPDGTVIGVNTAGNPDNLLKWFKKENKTPYKGTYTLVDSTITFSMKSEEGEVLYAGTLTSDNRLVLDVRSLINKYKGKEEYSFMRMEKLQ